MTHAGLVVHVYDPSTWEAEERQLQIWGQTKLNCKFQASLAI
jgi:hypothetical protein